MDLAAERSLSAVREFLIEHQQPDLVLFDGGSFGAFARALEAMAE